MSDSLATHRDRFETDPDARGSFDWLEESLFLGESWDELAECYRHRLTAPSLKDQPTQRASLQLRLAQLLEERLDDSSGAILAYRECVTLDPSLRAGWERLRGLYAARGSWTAVLQVAELQCAQTPDPGVRAKLLDEMGRVWEDQLGDAEQAETLYAQARDERAQAEPDADPAVVTEPSPVQRAWLAAARGDSETAVNSLREVLENDPSDVEALDMLVTVLEGAERHLEMADLLERRAALAVDPKTRAAVLARLGQVHDTHLRDVTGARSAYERALEADPENWASRDALGQVLARSHQGSKLRELLESSTRVGGPERRATAWCTLAALLVDEFDEPETAVQAYEEALALEPDTPGARESLEQLRAVMAREEAPEEPAPSENRAVRIVEVLERKLERMRSDGRDLEGPAVALRLRIAELRSSKLGDVDGAIAMLDCVVDPNGLQEVSQRLAFLYERAGRHEELIDLARRAADLSDDPEERADWYRRAAETARSVGDGEVAVAFYHCLLGERPKDRNSEAALLELHRARGEAVPLVELLRSELARANPHEEVALQLELADLMEASFEDATTALTHWRRALTLDASQVEALERGLRCAARAGGPLRQLDLLESLSETTDSGDLARILARKGDLMIDQLHWREEGAQSWRRSLELDPNQPALQSRLEALAA